MVLPSGIPRLSHGELDPGHSEEIDHVIDEIWRATGGKAIISTDVGQHQMFMAQEYPFLTANAHVSFRGFRFFVQGSDQKCGIQKKRSERILKIV